MGAIIGQEVHGGTFRCTPATRAAVVRYAVAKSNIAAEVA